MIVLIIVIVVLASRSEFSSSPTPSSSDRRRSEIPSPSPSLQRRYQQHQLAMRGTTPNIPLALSNQVNKIKYHVSTNKVPLITAK